MVVIEYLAESSRTLLTGFVDKTDCWSLSLSCFFKTWNSSMNTFKMTVNASVLVGFYQSRCCHCPPLLISVHLTWCYDFILV